MKVTDKLIHTWNAIMNRSPTNSYDYGNSYSTRPYVKPFNIGAEKTIISSIYTRIGIDVSKNNIRHVRVRDDGLYEDDIDSGLNRCLKYSANLDQTGRELIQDIVMSMIDEGCIAVVPVDTATPLNQSGSYDVLSLRTGRITQWYPEYVRVDLYDERNGQHNELVFSKREVAILANPLYEVMNGPNSTLQRLIRTLSHLDSVDSQVSSGKLDIIFQTPFSTRSKKREDMAKRRVSELEEQLNNSKYGIGYIDATERVIQLNRPIDNSFMDQIEYLTSMLYSQLGLTRNVFDGTADEKEMLNYRNRTIEPILSTITNEFQRKFLTQTAISQGQRIMWFVDPFGMASASEFADISDSLTRNAIVSTNEVRSHMGYKASDQEGADELRNKNLNADKNRVGELQNESKVLKED